MNVVNHPTEVKAGQTQAGSGNTDSGIIPEGAAEQMQQASTASQKLVTPNAPAPEATAEAPAVEVVAKPAASNPMMLHAAMHNLNLSVMFTLNLADERLFDLKDELSRVTLDETEVNMYNPFRKPAKRGETNPQPAGVVRFAIPGLLDIADQINGNRIMMIGKDSEIHANLRNAIETTRLQVASLIPGTGDTTIATLLADEETQEEVTLSVSDVVRVTSWLHSPKLSGDEAEAIAQHNAVLNMIVTSPALLESQEKAKGIAQIETILRLIQSKREDQSTNMLLAVNIDPAQLAEPAMRELLDTLLDDMGFVLYTRHELHTLEVADWLPQSKASVDRDVLAPTGDLLLVRLLGDEAEEEQGGEGEGAA